MARTRLAGASSRRLGLLLLAVAAPPAMASISGVMRSTSALFAAHDDDSSCRLYDAVGHDAAPVHTAQVLPLAVPAFLLAQLQGDCLLRFAALFDARGPPPLR